MAKFTKGTPKPAGSGIKKGQKQPKTLMRKRVEEILLLNGVDPVSELLHEVRQITKPEVRASIWLKLMEYTHPKLSAQAITVNDTREEENSEIIDVTPLTTEELLERAKEGEE